MESSGKLGAFHFVLQEEAGIENGLIDNPNNDEFNSHCSPTSGSMWSFGSLSSLTCRSHRVCDSLTSLLTSKGKNPTCSEL